LPAFFTEVELEFLKRRFEVQFGEAPRVRDGIVLKTWKSGPQKGQPRVPDAVQSLLERGLMEVRSGAGAFPSALFTDAGLETLRQSLLRDDLFSNTRFAHLRAELGT
jgi:hypothetical protein